MTPVKMSIDLGLVFIAIGLSIAALACIRATSADRLASD